jgi:hypothetical protein
LLQKANSLQFNNTIMQISNTMKRKGKIFWINAITAIFVASFIGSCKDENIEKVGVCPAIVSTIPAANATGIPLNQVISVTFNEIMDPATINEASFSLKGTSNVALKVAQIENTATSTNVETLVAGTVSYSGTTATFKPTSALVANTTYTGRIYSTVKDLTGNALQVDYVWNFSTGTFVSPTINATDPVSEVSCISLNKVITATFSVPMDPLTINDTTFIVKNGTTLVAGKVTYTGSIASFKPTNDFLPNTLYTVTLTTGAKNIAGTKLANNYVWKFTAGCNGIPSILSVDPVNNANGIILAKIVTVNFNEPMDQSTINATTFTIKNGATLVGGAISFTGNAASFKPTVNLLPNSVYTATVTTGVKNVAGIPITVNYVWSFTTLSDAAPTVLSTDPAINATGIELNKIITATFSEQMDQSTLIASTFTIKNGAIVVAGSYSYSGTTVSFMPTGGLMSGTTYTATITTGAKSLIGNLLASNYIWNFNTIASLGPLNVNLKSAGNYGILAGVGVSNNAGFSEIHDMNVGISPGARSSVTGFPPAIMVNGIIQAADDGAAVAALLTIAKQDLTDAYLFAEGATAPAPATVSGDLGGTTLAPGIYKSTSTLLIQSGDLTLDAQGDANAVWIFQIASAFTTVGGAGGNVILSGGAQAKNIYWQTGSSATIGDGTIFYGNILALTSITMNSGAKATGRMLARNGSVILTSTNIINKP